MVHRLTWSLCLGFLLTYTLPSQSAEPTRSLTKADIERWMKELSNWGRWGKDDQLGAVNLITPAKRREAAKLVQEGVSISLGHDAVTQKAADCLTPYTHQMLRTGLTDAEGASDLISVNYHGYVHTHFDALCHIFHQGKMYNGFAKEEVVESGAKKCGIEQLKDGIFARAILFDIPRLKGRDYLDLGEAIFPSDLDAWEKKAGIKVGSGDIVLIRTGRWARRAALGPWNMSKFAGLHASCMPWFKQRDIAILGSDSASDVMPSGVEGVAMPVHQIAVVAMGVWILDVLDMEQAGVECAKRNRWEFLFTVAPLRVVGGTGSPLNPIATF
ncbi:MAG: cyclase family protein [Verrucomicrobia bacterium]|nr:cyclase family protein [Verrucomicrobiota bacterium]